MESNKCIVQVYQGQLYLGTWDLAKIIRFEHRYMKKIIENPNYPFFIPLIPSSVKTKAKGGQPKEYLLNEEKLRLFIALMPTSAYTIWVKQALVYEISLLTYLGGIP